MYDAYNVTNSCLVSSGFKIHFFVGFSGLHKCNQSVKINREHFTIILLCQFHLMGDNKENISGTIFFFTHSGF